MKILGQIKNTDEAWKAVNIISFHEAVKSHYAPRRLEQWFEWGFNLQSIKEGRHQLSSYNQAPDRFKRLGNLVYPGWNSLLCCYGNFQDETSTSITTHRDHGFCENKVVMLNLGIADFTIDGKTHRLVDGVVVEFDSKLPHSARQLSKERANFSFRKVRESFLLPAIAEANASLFY